MDELILVYGATGTQGRPVAEGLLARGHRVRIMVRHPERAADLQQRGAEVRAGDLANADDVQRASEGVDQVFLLLPLGGNPVAFAQTAIEAARGAGVRRVVLNTSGQTPREPTGMPMMDYRIAVEAALRESALPHAILRPTAYLENLLGLWALPAVLEHGTLAYPIPETHRVSWVAAGDVGALAVAALERPEVAGAFDVGGPAAISGPQMAEALSRVTGRDIRYQAITPEAFGAMMGQVFGNPAMGDEATKAYRLTWEGEPDAMAVDMSGVLEALPVTLTPFEEWARMHAAAFTGSPQET